MWVMFSNQRKCLTEDEVLDILYNDDSGDNLIPELDSNSDSESDDEAYRTDIILPSSQTMFIIVQSQAKYGEIKSLTEDEIIAELFSDPLSDDLEDIFIVIVSVRVKIPRQKKNNQLPCDNESSNEKVSPLQKGSTKQKGIIPLIPTTNTMQMALHIQRQQEQLFYTRCITPTLDDWSDSTLTVCKPAAGEQATDRPQKQR
ncbi:hypothetical protein C0J52_11659 [Blattella germanica]|nr:hypothetical protein C0J52_11659 [Blattella germanica]